MKKIILFACFFLCMSGIMAQIAATRSTHFSQNGFVQNAGQFYDQHGRVNKQVDFLYAKDDFHIALNKTGFSYELIQQTTQGTTFPESGINDPDDLEDWRNLQDSKVSVCRINITLKGSNPHPEIITDHSTGTVFNYYLGKLKAVNVPSYNRVTYKDIYPGIDMVFEDHQSENGVDPEYSFIVHPGADVRQIKMIYSGAGNLHLEDQHTLTIATPNGYIKETGLRGYWLEDGAPSEVSFHLKTGMLSFNAKGDKNKTLIIDPSIVWGSYFGGPKAENNDTESEIALDSNDNVFLTGSTTSSQFIATTGSVMHIYGGKHDMFLAKFSPDGTHILWATFFGGSAMDIAYGVCCDSHNNALITGFTESADVITTSGAFQTTLQGKSDVLIAKFSNSGLLVWSTLMGGPQDSVEHEHGRSLICDAHDNVYICGYALSNSNISTTGAYQKKLHPNGDAFLVKFDSSGQKIWGTYFGASGTDRAHALCLDRFGHVYFAGTTQSKSNLVSNGFQTVKGGKTDALIAKFDSTGHYYWSSYYGGVEDDRGRGIKCDWDGYIYFDGWTNSSGANVISTSNGFQPNPGGSEDGFLVKFTPSGGRVWGTYLGAANNDWLYGMAIDAEANIYVTGSTNSGSNIASDDALQPTKGGLRDGMFAKFDSSGSRVWSTYFGGTGNEDSYDIEINNSGGLFVLFDTYGPLAVTPGAYQTIVRGQEDLAVFKFDLNSDFSELKGTTTLPALCDFHLKIYPNPSEGIITVELESSGKSEIILDVFDATGKMVLRKIVQAREGINIFPLDLSDLSAGTYLLKVKGSDIRTGIKFTIASKAR